MIRRELAKDPKMKEENWDRFLPKFKRKNVQRKKPRKVTDKADKPLFPPQQTPRKVDLELESGEYFLTAEQKRQKARLEKDLAQEGAVAKRKGEREAAFVAPSERRDRAAVKR